MDHSVSAKFLIIKKIKKNKKFKWFGFVGKRELK